MKHLSLNIISAFVAAFLLTACGDTENFTQINQTGVDVYASADDLPECTDENEGDQAYVKGETSARLCVDGEWFVTDHSSAKDTVYVGGDKLNCTTEELADKSGLKIVCNGDSIGVVLNGAKGDKGETGEEGKKGDTGCTISQNDTALTVTCGDSTTTVKLGTGKPAADTTVNDTSDAAVSLDSLAGYSQKGPFLKGSTVYLYELDNGKSLKQTNGNFTSYIMNDEGYYKFTSRKVNPYALVIVDGNYRNEVTGVVSAQSIKLKALSDVRKHHTGANVNILTHLEYERVYYLVTKMDYDFDEAKQKAQEEIFRAFNMVIESDKDAETLNIFGKTDADAALLALSIMLQGERSEADMMVLLTEISNDLATDGKWDDSTSNVDSVKASIADWLLRVDSDKRLERFHANVKGWHLGRDTTVPDFKRFLRNYVNVESGLGACASENRGTFANVQNVKSEYYAVAYDSIDASSNSLVRVVCDAEDGFHWRIATALERDTMGWSAQDDGTVQMGRIDTSMVYVYDGGWRHGTAIERILGLGCTEAREGSMKQDEGGSWYKCNRTSEMKVEESRWSTAWLEATPIEIDSLYWLTNRNETGTLLLGSNTGRVVVWDAGSLRNATALENDLGRGCVSYINGDSDTLGLHSSYTCLADGWYFDSVNVITDPRDGTTYRTIKIGTQYWMAENLNYDYKIQLASGEKISYGNYCYNNNCSLDSSKIFGRYYTWGAAIDSAAVFTDHGKGCGYNKTCVMTFPARGICPEGWHLPEQSEWEILYGAVTFVVYSLQAEGWDNWPTAYDRSGFTAIPAGAYANGGIGYLRSEAYLWSASEVGTTFAYYLNLRASMWNLADNGYKGGFGYSIRCVKD